MIILNKLIIVGVVLVIVGIGGYFVYTNTMGTSPTNSTTTNSAITKARIEISNFKHTPNRLTVKAGEVVTVINKDIPSHTVTSDTEGLFDTGLIGRNETKTFNAPLTPGEYPYHCLPHPSMTGVLVVEE